MKFSDIVKSRGYKNFMSKLYGIGAAIVIIGALFKITHIKGADIMLFVGLLTEAIIFFFSAFEPPHVEPDWSLVYPELAGMYHTPEELDELGLSTAGQSPTEQLDKMLEQAKIEPELIQSLGLGLKNLTDTVKNLNNVSHMALASDEFVATVKSVSNGAAHLGNSYRQTAEALEMESRIAQDHVQSLKNISTNAASLNQAYTQASESLKNEISFREQLNQNVAAAAQSAGNLIEKYNRSAETLQKAAEAVAISDSDTKGYKDEMARITRNLANLNSIYEMQMRSGEENVEATTQSLQAFNEWITKLKSTSEITTQFSQNVSALNKAFEAQIAGASGQAQKTEALQQAYDQLLAQLMTTIDNTQKYQLQADQLSKNMAALNNIYGNMLSAMTLKV